MAARREITKKYAHARRGGSYDARVSSTYVWGAIGQPSGKYLAP